jgi:hypothetical protein
MGGKNSLWDRLFGFYKWFSLNGYKLFEIAEQATQKGEH